MIHEYYAKMYCIDDISLIENYEKAISDNTQTWDCHHKLEIHTDYCNSRKDLILMHLYYKRPACELIFLTHSEHVAIHRKGKHHSEETCKKISNRNVGKHMSDNAKCKMSASHKGKPTWNKGKTLTKEHCKNLSIAHKGRKRIYDADGIHYHYNKKVE